MSKGNRRSNGKVARLPVHHRDAVEQMLLEGMTYREIVEYLQEQGHTMSQMAICTYAKKYLAEVQMLKIAQENFRMMMDEIDKYPNLDTTEGIIRVLSGYMFNAITSRTEQDWDELELDKLLRETNSLIRVAAHKKRVDVQSQNEFESSIEAARTLVFESLARDRPDLYKELSQYLSEQKTKVDPSQSI